MQARAWEEMPPVFYSGVAARGLLPAVHSGLVDGGRAVFSKAYTYLFNTVPLNLQSHLFVKSPWLGYSERMSAERITGAKRRLLERLKRGGPSTAVELAGLLGLTDVAVRQHLLALEANGLVRQRRQEPAGRGRPSVEWSLAPLAQEMFPDRHADLTVDLIEAARETFGQKGLDRLIERRAEEQIGAYRNLVASSGASLAGKVKALARQRTAEGYMAEVVAEKRGSYLLVEHHCPICEAARSCTGLCEAELEVFQESLGEGVRVERTQHLLSGGERCVYRICKAG